MRGIVTTNSQKDTFMASSTTGIDTHSHCKGITMAQNLRLYGKTALSVLGLCFGGMLYASDPEAQVQHSIYALRNFSDQVARVSTTSELTPKERLELKRDTGRLASFAYYQLEEAHRSFALTQNQYLSYKHQIRQATDVVKTAVRINKRSRSKSF